MTTEPTARISLVTLGVSNLSRSTAFYEALGFRRKARDAHGVAFFDAGVVVLSLWSTEELAKDAAIAAGEQSRFRGMALAWNCGSVDEVDAAMARALAAGATMIRPCQKVFW